MKHLQIYLIMAFTILLTWQNNHNTPKKQNSCKQIVNDEFARDTTLWWEGATLSGQIISKQTVAVSMSRSESNEREQLEAIASTSLLVG